MSRSGGQIGTIAFASVIGVSSCRSNAAGVEQRAFLARPLWTRHSTSSHKVRGDTRPVLGFRRSHLHRRTVEERSPQINSPIRDVVHVRKTRAEIGSVLAKAGEAAPAGNVCAIAQHL